MLINLWFFVDLFRSCMFSVLCVIIYVFRLLNIDWNLVNWNEKLNIFFVCIACHGTFTSKLSPFIIKFHLINTQFLIIITSRSGDLQISRLQVIVTFEYNKIDRFLRNTFHISVRVRYTCECITFYLKELYHGLNIIYYSSV